MRYVAWWIALIGVWAPLAAGGQQAAPPPLDILLENRQTLALTPEQILRLEEIRSGLEARNEPLIQRVLALRAQFQREQRALNRASGRRGLAVLRNAPLQGQGQPEIARLEEIRTQIRSLVLEIDANNRAAMTQEVNPMLDRQQKARLRELVQARRPAAQGRAGARGPAGTLRPPVPLGS